MGRRDPDHGRRAARARRGAGVRRRRASTFRSCSRSRGARIAEPRSAERCGRSPDPAAARQRPANLALPGPSARNDCTPVRASSVPNDLDERVAVRGRARRRAAGRGRRRSRAWRAPSRRPRPCRARAAQCSADCSSSPGVARPGRRDRSRAPPSARTCRPLHTRSLAWAGPTSRVRRCVPPAPGMMPSRISGWPEPRGLARDAEVAGAARARRPPPSA